MWSRWRILSPGKVAVIVLAGAAARSTPGRHGRRQQRPSSTPGTSGPYPVTAGPPLPVSFAPLSGRSSVSFASFRSGRGAGGAFPSSRHARSAHAGSDTSAPLRVRGSRTGDTAGVVGHGVRTFICTGMVAAGSHLCRRSRAFAASRVRHRWSGRARSTAQLLGGRRPFFATGTAKGCGALAECLVRARHAAAVHPEASAWAKRGK